LDPRFHPSAIVSVGDSIASGEGGRWAGNTSGPPEAVDALGDEAYFDGARGTGERITGCHRSSSAELYIDIGLVEAANFACSGALTVTVPRDEDGNFKPGLDFYNSHGLEGQALMLQRYAAHHDVKLVLVSIGGNNLGIRQIVTRCVEGYANFPDPTNPQLCGTVLFVPHTFEHLTRAIVTALLNVHQAMVNAHRPDDAYRIVVQDYPLGLASSDDFRYDAGIPPLFTGGCPFWDTDATFLNRVVVKINATVHDAVRGAGLPNTVLLQVADALRGHRLCQQGVRRLEEARLRSWESPSAQGRLEWENQVFVSAALPPPPGGPMSPYQLVESLHPNYWGQLALRNCLRLAYGRGAVRGGVCTPAERSRKRRSREDGPRMVLR
jgi:hypothetical protein